jgi:hypothetical protein
MEIELFSPHIGQQKIIDGFADSEHKFGIVATGRQFGKSLLAQNLMLYWLLGEANMKGAWITPVYNQCQKIFDELTNASHEIIIRQNKSALTIEFVNGSTLKFLSTDNYNTIRGFSFDYMVLDEAAYIKQDAIEQAVLPTLSAIGKKCLIISTPKSKNWFYEYFMRGNTQNPTYTAFKGISQDNPHVNQDFILEQQKSLPKNIFDQEYYAEFTDAGNDVFTNLDMVCILDKWDDDTRGKRYFAGIDLGLQNDYSVLCIMDDGGTVAYMERINGTSYADITKSFVASLKRYQVTSGYCEINGPGLPVFEVIHSHNRKIDSWITTNDNKVNGIRKLIYDLQESNLVLPSKHLFSFLHDELSIYTYKMNANGSMNFSAPSGFHDDTIMALMLANESRNAVFKRSKFHIGTNIKPKFGGSLKSY